MKLGNANRAKTLEVKHEVLTSHKNDIVACDTSNLPTSQEEKYNLYLSDLQKQIKSVEKEITEL